MQVGFNGKHSKIFTTALILSWNYVEFVIADLQQSSVLSRQRILEREREADMEVIAEDELVRTVGKILCCQCGTPIEPNPANLCVGCLRTQIDITEGIPKQVKPP